MSKNISLDEIKDFWPDKAPDINIVQKYIEKYKDEKIVIKYGGNVLIDRNVFNNFISDINVLNRLGLSVVVVHGGGPRIKRELDKKKIVSKFINGLRVTDKNIIETVEEVLIDFNKDIASSLRKLGSQVAMFHTKTDNIIEVKPEREELGFVGIPNKINDNFNLIQVLGGTFQDKNLNPVINQNTGFNLSILKAKKGKLENLKFSKPTIMFAQKGVWQINIDDFVAKLNPKDTISIPINSQVDIEINDDEESLLNCVTQI